MEGVVAPMSRRISRVCALAALGLLLSFSQASACACCGTYRVVNVAHWDVLNIRTGPGVGYGIIGAFAPNDGCIVFLGERRGAWVRVSGNGVTGWVHSGYLQYVQ